MKSKMFDKGLFCDVFKQLTPISILFIGIMTLFSMLYNLNMHDYLMHDYTFTRSYIISMLSINGATLLYSVISPALMTVFAFGFLYDRKSSDFYHCIPESRVSLFTSVFTGVIAWSFIGIVFETFLNIVSYKIFSSDFNYILNYKAVLPGILSLLSIVFVSAASFALAASFSGKAIQNIIFGIMVLLTPEVFIFMMGDFFRLAAPYISHLSFLDSYNNLCTAIFFEGMPRINFAYDFSVNEFGQSLLNRRYIFTTFLIGLVLFCTAQIVFKKRQSEIAGTIKSNKKQSIIIGAWIGSFITLIAVYKPLASAIFTSATESVYYIVMVHLLAFAVYLFYIFLTTDERKAIPKMTLGFITVLFVESVLLGITGIVLHNASFVPNAKDVESVSVCFNNRKYHSLSVNAELTDPEAIQIITESLENEILMSKTDEWGEYITDYEGDDFAEFDVTFKTVSGNKSAVVTVVNPKMETLLQIISENPDCVKFGDEIPKIDETNSYIFAASVTCGANTDNEDFDFDPYKLYECVKTDLKNGAGTNDYTDSGDGDDCIAYIRFCILKDYTTYEYEFYAYGDEFVNTKEYVESCSTKSH